MFSIIFPGQGSQSIGMAKEFYDTYPIVKEIFYRADNALGYPISKIILQGPLSEINLTENTQPAIFVVSYSIFSVIKKIFKVDLNKAKYFAGHSLGEYSALTCADGIDFEDAVRLLSKRGKSMQTAVPLGEGSMLAILGIKIKDIEQILNDNIHFKYCQVANDNCPGQIVVSGPSLAINALSKFLKDNSIKSIGLPVSAPFHSHMMKKSTEIMISHINDTKFKIPVPQIISNVTAKEENNPKEIKKLLIHQIEGRVRWRESIEFIIKNGVSKFVEIGPGKVLTGLVRRINKNIKIFNINSISDIKNYINQ